MQSKFLIMEGINLYLYISTKNHHYNALQLLINCIIAHKDICNLKSCPALMTLTLDRNGRQWVMFVIQLGGTFIIYNYEPNKQTSITLTTAVVTKSWLRIWNSQYPYCFNIQFIKISHKYWNSDQSPWRDSHDQMGTRLLNTTHYIKDN
jgi:hypothetical protein